MNTTLCILSKQIFIIQLHIFCGLLVLCPFLRYVVQSDLTILIFSRCRGSNFKHLYILLYLLWPLPSTATLAFSAFSTTG